MAKNSNGKVTIPKLYEEIIPIKETVIEIKTLLNTHLKSYEKDCNENREEHKTFWKTFVSKNSFKVVSIIGGILLIVITIIEVVRVI